MAPLPARRRRAAGGSRLSPGAKARLAARAALARKAVDLVVLDVQGLCGVTDYFLIANGASTTQVGSIADAVEAALRTEGARPAHREGVPDSGWVLLDYGDVIVHVFLPDTRHFYALERLWGDAPQLAVDAERA